MNKRVFGRKFSRARKGRTALLRSLAREFILQGTITTTVARSKALKPLIDQLVTKAKKNTLTSHRSLLSFFGQNESVVKKLENETARRFVGLQSGFTRSVRGGTRRGDGANVVRVTWSREAEKEIA